MTSSTTPAPRPDPGAAAQRGDPRPLVLLSHLVEPPGRITGISRYAFGLMEALVARGRFRYALATSFAPADLPAGLADGLERLVVLPHIASTPLNYVAQTRALARLRRALAPDVVYAMNPMCPPMRGVPTIVTLHDMYMEVLPELYAARHRLWWRLFFGRAAAGAALVACVSRNTAADAQRLHPRLAGRTALVAGAGVLPLAPPDAPASRGLQKPYVLFLGNVTPNKNVGFLVRALRRLAAEGQPVHAYHVGRDHDGEFARAGADAPALIRSLGALDDETLDATLRGAAALVQPSRYEGFGLPIIEAHERGTPVVASDIPVFREVAGDGALLVPLDDDAALAQALRRVTQDADLAARLAAGARANAGRFGWDKSAAMAEDAVGRALAATTTERGRFSR